MKNTAVAIGTFDGFHTGHKYLIDRLASIARKRRLKSAIITLSSPVRKSSLLLTTLEEKIALLKHQPVDMISVLRTGPEVTSLPAEDFFAKFIVGEMGARHIVVGTNFAFGHNREGDIDWLRKRCKKAGIALETVRPLEQDGGPVSSSRIRALLHEGSISAANRLLGRPYLITGIPVKGRQLGRKIGFPTINLGVSAKKLLPPGIFAGITEKNGKYFPAAVNIGTRPTVERNGSLLVEIFLLDFKGNWPRKKTRLYLLKHIRSEKRFSGIDKLKEQITKDVSKARIFFAISDSLHS